MDNRCSSAIRLLHAAPGAPPVDVYANDWVLASNLAFANLSSYISLGPGKYNIKIYPAGSRREPVLAEDITVLPNRISTIAVINRLNNIALMQIIDLLEVVPAGLERNAAYIRAAHLSPNAPAVDVGIDSWTIATNISYRNISRYVPVCPATYNLSVSVAGTGNTVLNKENVVLQPGFYYTMYVLGLVNEEPPLQAIVPIDGLYRSVML